MVASTLEENSLGRAYSLGEVARAAGLDFEVVSCFGSKVWAPLRTHSFASRCHKVSPEALREKIEQADAVIALKPLPNSLGQCIEVLGRSPRKLIVDVDDPDIELRLNWARAHILIPKFLFRRRELSHLVSLAKVVGSLPKIVSNPSLQAKYGGVVIPHVRSAEKTFQPLSRIDQVAFVGTRRRHKGIRKIRQAVRRINEAGFPLQLCVTDIEPRDAYPWEVWAGHTSLEEGRLLLQKSKCVVITLWREPYRSYQLPAKAADALVQGARVVHNPTAPLSWLVGASGITIKSRSTRALVAALLKAVKMGPVSEREVMGARKKLDPATYSRVLLELVQTVVANESAISRPDSP